MKVAVIGDVCDDVFMYGRCNRLCPEAPVPVFNPIAKETNLGMAGNVLTNMLALGAKAKLFGNKEKITKTRYIENKSNQMIMRLDIGEEHPLSRISRSCLEEIKSYGVVIISDYDKGFLDEKDIDHISSYDNLVFMDTKKRLGSWCDNVDFVKINKKEFDDNGGYNNEWINNNQGKLIITLGSDGVHHDGVNYPIENPVQTIDISGAGDTFLCGFVHRFLQDNDVSESIKFAQQCATSAVQQRGISCIQPIKRGILEQD
jgi:D-beta-D-heptose 7-phosphate kinase/D-beta-D-heptose 1-phosphate adenosyltransferase